MAVKRKYRLNLRNYGNLPAIMLSQYDEGYALEFEIRDGTDAASDLSAYTVALKGTRADTLAYSFAGTVSTNVLTFVIDTTMTACDGRGTAEIAIKDTANDVLFATFNMPVFVERAAVPEGSIDADVERAREIAEQVQEIVDNAAAAVSGEAEKWATGQINGTDVPSTDPTYENNAKYYAEQAADAAASIGIDATLTQTGKAADAKKTGDELDALKEDFNSVKDATIETVYPQNWWNEGGNGHYDENGVYTSNTYEKWARIDGLSEGDVLRLYQWQGAYYSPQTQITRVCAYDSSGAVVPSASPSSTVASYIIPNGVISVILSINSAIVTKPLVTKNIDAPPVEQVSYFDPYINQKTDKTLSQVNVSADADAVGKKFSSLVADSVDVILPEYVYGVVGGEINLYHKNILFCGNADNYGLVWHLDAVTNMSRGYNECLRLTPDRDATANSPYLNIIDRKTGAVLKKKPFKIRTRTADATERKALFIGDSLTEAGYYPAEIKANLSGGKISLLGTRTRTVTINNVDIPVATEGRGGWSAVAYVTKDSYNGVTNAFWNPNTSSFDFSYYMSNNSYSGVDIVVITLGTNDAAALSNMNLANVIDAYSEMITSIHEYDSDIKIIISLTTPSAERNGWGNTSGRLGTPDEFDYYQKQIVSSLISTFSSTANVYFALTYANLDTAHDFPYTEVAVSARNPLIVSRQTDNVHPSIYGYLKFADAIWAAIVNATVE